MRILALATAATIIMAASANADDKKVEKTEVSVSKSETREGHTVVGHPGKDSPVQERSEGKNDRGKEVKSVDFSKEFKTDVASNGDLVNAKESETSVIRETDAKKKK